MTSPFERTSEQWQKFAIDSVSWLTASTHRAVVMSHHIDKQLFNTVRDASASVDDVVKLLRQGADPNRRGKYGSTPLEKAASNGHFEIVKLLLDAGADPSIRSDDNSSPLYWAAANGHVSVMQILLDHGAEPNAYRDQGQSPLLHAISEGHIDAVRLLLTYGADRDYVYFGSSALDYAERYRDTEMARIIKTTRWSPRHTGRQNKAGDS